MKFGNDMITFEEAVAYLKDMPALLLKNPADSRDLKWFLKNSEIRRRICGSSMWRVPMEKALSVPT